ncbi:hypothetical protein ES707_11397 [subsurface metagenome]
MSNIRFRYTAGKQAGSGKLVNKRSEITKKPAAERWKKKQA